MVSLCSFFVAQSLVNLEKLGNLVNLGIALPTFITKLSTLLKLIKLPNKPPSNQHTLSSKVVRCGLSQKSRRWAVLRCTAHCRDFFDSGSRCLPYHQKLLDALVILTGTSINTNLIASVDKQGHLDGCTSVYGSSLE